MRIAYGFEGYEPPSGGTVLTVGNFDGVHCGHARLVETAHSVARRLGAGVAVMTFDRHPLAVLAPERAPAQLVTLPERLALLERLGVQACIVLHSEPELLARSAADFLASLITHCRPRALVEGPDFHFGRGRTGTLATLQEHAAQWGYEVHAVPAQHCAELPTAPIISSTSIRQALRDGRIDEANAMLGRPYRISGVTGMGEGRGAGLGIPTANLHGVTHLVPQEAVYAAVAQLAGGGLYLAAVNVGPQPTFDQATSRIEAHLIGYHGDLLNQDLGLHFLARLRTQTRFSGPDELVAQIRRDVSAVREHAGELEAFRAVPLLPL
jgi:riboflavin kinase / FMN adenylyltransferase